MVKQNIVFVENKAGSLKRVTGMLADNDINIYGFACFDAPEFAIFRMICDNPDKAEMILNQREQCRTSCRQTCSIYSCRYRCNLSAYQKCDQDSCSAHGRLFLCTETCYAYFRVISDP